MKRQDFELIADIIRNMVCEENSRVSVARAFADRLAGINPNFDRARFLKACGKAGLYA